jgi:UDP-N-acetylglucosamine--N-acetylmuramyl-(pentapeptide) pyrophosphoryl-undecaprenol N-acetylglucosamine transferase
MKILIAGGGTGGHIYPAIAIANELKYRHPDWQFEFIGKEDSIEGRVVKSEGYPLRHMDVWGYERMYNAAQKAKVLYKLGISMFESVSLLRKIKPDIVIGTGGYVCGPIVYTAALKKYPTLITEQNVIPGFTIKTLSKVASTVCVSFPESVAEMARPERCVVTGNPVRRDFGLYSREVSRKMLKLRESDKFILVFGGSLGANSINEAVRPLLMQYASDASVRITHITGEGTYRAYTESLKADGFDLDVHKNIEILAYSDDMPMLLNAADLVICRSGATTLAEVNYVGVAAVYIPYPYATNDHQMKNAVTAENKGAAVIVPNDELQASALYSLVKSLIGNDRLLREMAAKSRAMGVRNSAQLLCDEVEKLLALKK